MPEDQLLQLYFWIAESEECSLENLVNVGDRLVMENNTNFGFDIIISYHFKPSPFVFYKDRCGKISIKPRQTCRKGVLLSRRLTPSLRTVYNFGTSLRSIIVDISVALFHEQAVYE
jgi:hypothetical protein